MSYWLSASAAVCACILASCAGHTSATAGAGRDSLSLSPSRDETSSTHASGRGRFTRGSTAAEVASAMGSPDTIREKDGGIAIWSYGFSTVTLRSGRVKEWADHGRNLKAQWSSDSLAAASDGKRHQGTGADSAIMSPELAASIAARQVPGQGSGPTNPSVQYVEAYQKGNGSRVEGHYRTRADSSSTNNFSSRGNVNPSTGKRGYR